LLRWSIFQGGEITKRRIKIYRTPEKKTLTWTKKVTSFPDRKAKTGATKKSEKTEAKKRIELCRRRLQRGLRRGGGFFP